MKKILLIILCITSFIFFPACKKDDGDNPINNNGGEEYNHTINYIDEIDEDYRYTSMQLFDGDKEIPLYNCKTNFSQTWNGEAPMRMNNAVGIIELSGVAKFRITGEFKIDNNVTIRPLAKNVEYRTFDNQLEFIIKENGDYTIEFPNQRTLHLFVYSIENEEVDANTIYFGPGVHNKNNSSFIDSNNRINVDSNTHIHLALGAIVEGRIVADSKTNVLVTGRGIIAGAKFDRSVERGTTLVPFDFNNSSNITFKDIVCLDPAGWCYNMYFCNNVTIDGIKIISSRSNGDGISIQSCYDVLVQNVFVRSWDDSLVVKNYPKWTNRNIEGVTRNIVFKNCILWTDLAQSMEIGYETVGEVLEDVHFENITVLHNYHKAVISIHNGNNAHINDVSFKNVIVEDASMGKGDGTNRLIDIQNLFSSTWSTQHKTTSLGFIEGVRIENVKVYNANNPEIVISGTYDARTGYDNSLLHYVKDVLIKDLYINDVKIDDSYSNLVISNASNIVFE